MIILLSPAKTLDFESPSPVKQSTKPAFHKDANRLAAQGKKLSVAELRKLMSISENLGEQVQEYFANWSKQADTERAKQALFAFRGDVYRGFNADTLEDKTVDFAQRHLRILSGLYGVLRPLDLMQPYRLEMGTKHVGKHGKDLYEYWGDRIARELDRTLEEFGDRLLINLASNEYFKAAQANQIDCQLVTPVFKELHKGKYQVLSFFAKPARGMMARYLCEKQIDSLAGLRRFRREGYRYNAELSTEDKPVFTRPKP
ncbi:peroxide stress protein YaaA [Adhaeretor mobilis]|uniref:UPF0246 protein HG15A2_34100 n=1 Tax=Adhaeretor mobilis TaxID=1930276 RepID=A0A517MYX1_9BACT|nr:peroxide stress protein YaaA [Adhaeretor mobilis]QDT00075.1 hypothetical protein HG15A2_34100 [Adhaeretor mobilis]